MGLKDLLKIGSFLREKIRLGNDFPVRWTFRALGGRWQLDGTCRKVRD